MTTYRQSHYIFIWPLIIVFTVLWMVTTLQSAPITLAVLDFKDNSPFPSSELKPMEQGLATMMITTFSQINSVKVIERSQLRALFEEMALGQSGMIDEQSAQQVGKLSGAQYLVFGSFMKGMKNDIRIDVRIVRTETGVTLKAEEVSGKLKDILKLMSKLSDKVVKDLAIRLSGQDKRAMKDLDGSCSSDVVMQYFQAVHSIDQRQYRKADRMLAKIMSECPEFKRAAITRRQMRAQLKRELQKKQVQGK